MKEVKRGFEPKDPVEFGEAASRKLSQAAEEIYFLLNRGYDTAQAVTFVGNHYLLSERQRMALTRILSPEQMVDLRRQKELASPTGPLQIDGFNLLITLEVALSGSLLIAGIDGTIRDLAGLRGSYRIVDKTVQAIDLLFSHLQSLQIKSAVIYLDQPVSNSGRLRALLLDKAQGAPFDLKVEIVPNPDRILWHYENVVTSDAIILNECASWYNLGRRIIETSIPNAWIYRLSSL